MSLTKEIKELYSRQIMMKEIGEEGQEKLRRASVLVVGCGGLGASVLYYLTAMGIGHLGLCDCDTVSLSNLNRQILFTAKDISKPKARSASIRLLALNPNLITTVYDQYMNEELAKEIVPAYDIVVDCLDNFETRFILNDSCVNFGKPFIHAGIEGFCGQIMTIIPGKSPCLRCLFPNGVKEQKKQFGVIGTTPGVIGTVQALEVAKQLLGLPVFIDGLVTYDGLDLTMEKVILKASQDCICKKGF